MNVGRIYHNHLIIYGLKNAILHKNRNYPDWSPVAIFVPRAPGFMGKGHIWEKSLLDHGIAFNLWTYPTTSTEDDNHGRGLIN